MNTREAFEQMIHERAWYKDLGIEKNAAGAIVFRFRNRTITVEKMEELLEKKGFKVKQEKLWEK